METSLEEEEGRTSRIQMSKQFDYSKHQRMFFPSKNMGIKRLNMGMTVQFASSSSINGSDKIFGYEWSSLSQVHSIRNGAPR